jgi:hypothetical protein
VSASERPACGAVIKFPVGPDDSIVASGTERSGEGSGDVIGNETAQGLSASPIRGVTAVTIRIGAGEIVIVVGMALRACRGDMRAGQRPTRAGVIKCGGCPRDSVMATGAIGGRELRPCCGVCRIVRLLPGGEMAARVAAIVGLNSQIVIVVDVA